MTDFVKSSRALKSMLLIGGVVLITVGVIVARPYLRAAKDRAAQSFKLAPQTSVITIEDVEAATSTDRIREVLEKAFTEHQLLVAGSYPIPKTTNELVLAAPGFSSSTNQAISGCDLQENPYCGLYITGATGTRLVAFGPKLAGFSKVERFIDSGHAQILTSWTLYQFTSTDRKQLNLETGEIIPLLVTETDQDDRSATLNVSGSGVGLTVRMRGTTVASRLAPDGVDVINGEGKVVFTLPDSGIVPIQHAFEEDADRRLKPIHVLPTDDDVETNTLTVQFYGVPFKLDLKKHLLESV
jgi:hypothetical protein